MRIHRQKMIIQTQNTKEIAVVLAQNGPKDLIVIQSEGLAYQ